MVLEEADISQGSYVHLPNKFMPLSELDNPKGPHQKYHNHEIKLGRGEVLVASFGGVVRKIMDNKDRKMNFVINCQDSTNNSSGLDFPITLDPRDFEGNTFPVFHIEEGDTFVGINFGIMVSLLS